MTNDQVSQMTRDLTDALKPYIDGLVAEAVREIPFRIREEMSTAVDTELRRVIRARVESQIAVTVKVTNCDG